MAKFEEVFSLIRNGASIKQFDMAKGLPITRIETISDREVNREKFGYADIFEVGKYCDYVLQDQDILMSHINSEKHLGKAAIYRKREDEIIIHGMNLLVLRAKKEILNPEYALLFFNTSRFLDQIKTITKKSVNQASFSISALKELEIELPLISTQQQIVIEIGKIDKIIACRKQQLEKLDELVKARFIELFGAPEINPNGYPVRSMADIATYWNGLTYKPEDVSEEGTIVLRSSNIQNMQLDFADTVRVSCKIGEKKYVQENDILMCSRNGSAKLVGKVALIKGLAEPMSFGAFMMIIRSDYYPYLMTYFQMAAFRSQIVTGATTTINQITGSMMDKVFVPVPDRRTMDEFADVVSQVDKSKAEIQKSLEQLETLKKALMQKYFG